MDQLKENLAKLQNAMRAGKIFAAASVGHKGILPTLIEMGFGNDISIDAIIDDAILYSNEYGSFVVEASEIDFGVEIGHSSCKEQTEVTINGKTLDYDLLKQKYLSAFDEVFGGEIKEPKQNLLEQRVEKKVLKSTKPVDVPKVVIPVFPGTNCEWDLQRAFIAAGAETEIIVINNLSIQNIEESVDKFAQLIRQSQILALPGGFSLGDEPDGSGKFIASLLRNAKIESAIEHLLTKNDGLIIGICNGFQALIKTGLLPHGKISTMSENSPTLTYNNNGRHIARHVDTIVHPNNSPWLAYAELGKVYRTPISHGEGRFVCSEEDYKNLVANGQIAFTYIDNPNGSAFDIEGITSPCGKILGKMGHSERVWDGLYKNIPEMLDSQLFQAGVDYFKK